MPVAGDYYQSAVIASGQTKSGAIDITGAKSVGLIFPATFDAVAVTFEGSADGTTYNQVSVMATAATQAVLTLTSNVQGKAISLPQELAAFAFIKIVAGGAVAADRTILVCTGS
jgi:hypothetical protein